MSTTAPQPVTTPISVQLSELTGCEFSVAQELLVSATVEGSSDIQQWDGQKNVEDSVA